MKLSFEVDNVLLGEILVNPSFLLFSFSPVTLILVRFYVSFDNLIP